MSRFPAMNPAFAIAEVIWIMAGRRDLKFLSFWNTQYAAHVGNTPDLHGAYGYRLRAHLDMDQLVRAYHALKGKSDSRQVVLQIWDARQDMPLEDGSETSGDIPCNVVSMLKIRGGRLEWMQILRSNDLVLGVPHNIVQFTSLQEIMAGWLGIDVGSYNHLSDSLHIYERDLDNLRKPEPVFDAAPNMDSIAVPKDESDRLFSQLAERAELLTLRPHREEQIDAIATWKDAPAAYQNLLCILAAESARRWSYPVVLRKIARRCQNPALSQLWDRWMRRVSRSPQIAS